MKILAPSKKRMQEHDLQFRGCMVDFAIVDTSYTLL
jgi:hypothetical protein